MYCGDETGAFIGELTSSSCRFGYGGEDCPKSVLSSFMYRDGTIPTTTHRCTLLMNKHLHPPSSEKEQEAKNSSPAVPTDDDDIVPIFQPYPRHVGIHKQQGSCGSTDPWDYLHNGVIENWDAWENAWHKSFQQLHVRSLYKHTKGGTQISTPRLHSSGLASSSVSGLVSGLDEKDAWKEGEIMHPILTVDHGNTHFMNRSGATDCNMYSEAIIRKQRCNMLEILHESLRAPATFIAPSPMLASFANGRQTSLVVDVGAGGTRVTPIVDGLILQQAQRRNGRGGDWLCAIQERVVGDILRRRRREDGVTVVPRYAVGLDDRVLERMGGTVFHQMAVRDCMFEMKSAPHGSGVAVYRNDDWTVPFVQEKSGKENEEGGSSNNINASGDHNSNGCDGEDDERMNKMDVDGNDDDDDDDESDDEDVSYDIKCKRYYKLPDGTRVNLRKNKDLCRLDELLFASELPFSPSNSSSSLSNSATTLSNLPIHELIKDSLMAVSDADVRKELCGNIILTGAASLVPNIEQRLSLEVQYLVPSMYKCKVIATRNTVERRFASWIGGSILSSLGSFQQLWLSKKEYEEYGGALSLQRFP